MAHRPGFPLVFGVLVFLTFLAGCTEDDPDVSWSPQVQVRVLPGGQSLAGVKVVAMDPVTNLPAAGVQVSDADGLCTFSDLPEGVFQLVAFGGPDHFVVRSGQLIVGAAKAAAGAYPLPAAPEKTPPAPPPAEILVGTLQSAAGLPRFSGQVVAADGGDPLENAFVGTSPFLSGYAGETTYKDDVTLADGRFSVAEIAVAIDQETGHLTQVEALLVTCAGYRPRRWTHSFAPGDENLDVSGVTIALERVQDQDTGVLRGRLLLAGQPAAGVTVGLGGITADKSSVGMPGYTAVTDQDGIYRFGGLPGGIYFVHPGFQPGDGFFYPGQAGTVGQAVTPDQETQAADLVVLREVDLVHPANGSVFSGGEDLAGFRWSEVPGATSYTVYLDRGVVGTTEAVHIDLPEDWNLVAGSHLWSVQANLGVDLIIGATQVRGVFYISEGSTP